jgi:hypothetical protein
MGDPRQIAIQVVTFGADGWAEQRIAEGQLAALNGGQCSRVPSELEQLSRKAQEEHARFCASEADARAKQAKALRAQELNRLLDAVRSLKPEPERACTAVYDAIRMAEYSDHGLKVTILSDFAETCRKTVPKAQGPAQNQVFAVPVMQGSGEIPDGKAPAIAKSESEYFDHVRDLLEKNFPEIRVLEPYRMSEVLR